MNARHRWLRTIVAAALAVGLIGGGTALAQSPQPAGDPMERAAALPIPKPWTPRVYYRFGETIHVAEGAFAAAKARCDPEDTVTGGGFDAHSLSPNGAVLESTPDSGAATDPASGRVDVWATVVRGEVTGRATVACLDLMP